MTEASLVGINNLILVESKYFRPECKKCTREAFYEGKNEAAKLAGKPPVPNVGACCGGCGRDPGAKKNDPTKANFSLRSLSRNCYNIVGGCVIIATVRWGWSLMILQA